MKKDVLFLSDGEYLVNAFYYPTHCVQIIYKNEKYYKYTIIKYV